MDFVKILRHLDLFVAHQREEVPNLPDYAMHMHDYYELYLLLEGNVEFCIEATVYPLHAGDILLIRPGETHVARVDPQKPYDRLYFHFHAKLLRETLNGKLLTPFSGNHQGALNYYPAETLPQGLVQVCVGQVFREESSQMRTLVYLLPILQAIYDIWQHSLTTTESHIPTELPNRIVAYTNQYLYELKNPAQLAQHFFMSESQLNRIFRNYLGTSVWEYVRLKRLFAAKEMISSGMLPQKAAVASGYGEYSTFFRAYKKQFEHSPKADYEARGIKRT